MAHKILKFSEVRQKKQYRDIAEVLLESRLARANWLQRLVLKKLLKKDVS